MPKTRKIKNINKNRKIKNTNKNKIKNITGGALENYGFPSCNNFSQFTFSDDNISSFQRVFLGPFDCVISALQIIGIINPTCANIMRITALGVHGITTKQLEYIMMFATNKNMSYACVPTYIEWATFLSNNLNPGHLAFVGYLDNTSGGHVFLIARHPANNMFYLIDPQSNFGVCQLGTPECDSILNIDKYGRQWCLLMNSSEYLTNQQATFVSQNLYSLLYSND